MQSVLDATEATCFWSHTFPTCVQLFGCLSKAPQHKSNKEMCVWSVLNFNEAQMRTDQGAGISSNWFPAEKKADACWWVLGHIHTQSENMSSHMHNHTHTHSGCSHSLEEGSGGRLIEGYDCVAQEERLSALMCVCFTLFACPELPISSLSLSPCPPPKPSQNVQPCRYLQSH